ncbi:MAG: hypothetical protein ACXW3O_00670 [Brevundimonas sp.]
MRETPLDSRPDFRPALAICAYDVGQTAWDAAEDLSGEPWNPAGARTLAVAADAPEALATVLSARLADPHVRGLLLVGRTAAGDGFRIQVRALNRTLDGTRRLHDVGPGVVRATAPGADMVEALNAAGLPASVSSEAEDDAGSYLLYRILSDLPEGIDTPAVGLLRAPLDASEAMVRRAVKAAAQAVADHLAPLPRSRAS